jgi:mRNA interferase RelE/StbE
MNYKIVYHQKVVNDDIPKLSSIWKNRIRTAIENRLSTRPDFYGKPLRKSLKGYRKLRVEDYRVIFKVEGNKIVVLMIAHRSVVYTKINKRM